MPRTATIDLETFGRRDAIARAAELAAPMHGASFEQIPADPYCVEFTADTYETLIEFVATVADQANLPDVLERVAAATVLAMHPEYANPLRSRNQCSIAVQRLSEVMRRPVHHVRVSVETEGDHWVALLPSGRVVDLTERQFDPNAECPQWYPSLAALEEHWRVIETVQSIV